MPNKPKTKHRSVRVPDDTWKAAIATTEEAGTSVGEIVRDFLNWYLRLPGARMPRRPGEPLRERPPGTP